MRNLTIRRNKTYVACLVTDKVYVEDPASGDITVGGVPCRKIGELKNGEEKTFSLENEAVGVYIVSDMTTKDANFGYYPVPAGDEDVFLSGRHKMNPAAGNPFCFDGRENEDNERTREARKSMKRRFLYIVITTAVMGFLLGLNASGAFDSCARQSADIWFSVARFF